MYLMALMKLYRLVTLGSSVWLANMQPSTMKQVPAPRLFYCFWKKWTASVIEKSA